MAWTTRDLLDWAIESGLPRLGNLLEACLQRLQCLLDATSDGQWQAKAKEASDVADRNPVVAFDIPISALWASCFLVISALSIFTNVTVHGHSE